MKLTNKKRNVIFVLLVAACVLTTLVQTSLTTALAPIMDDLMISADTAQWLISGYSLVMGISTLTTAFLIRRYPSRFLTIVSLGLFSFGVLLSALSRDFALLLTGRLLQAAGCGVLLSLTQVVILSIFPEDKKGSVMGIYGLSISAAPVVAPAVCGVVIDHWGWQYFFWIILALSAALLVVAIVCMDDVFETEKVSFDVLSMLECSVGFCGILLAIGDMNGGISRPAFFVPCLLGIVFLIMFVHRQNHLEQPFLQLSLFKNKEFRIAVIVSIILYAAMMGASTLIALYIQSMLGKSATVSGMVTVPGAVASAVVTLVAGRLYDKTGIRKLYITGALFVMIASFGCCNLSSETSLIYTTIVFALRSFGIGLLLMPTITWGLSTVDKKLTADGTALLTSLRTIAGAFGSTVFVVLMTAKDKIATGTEMIPGLNLSFTIMAALTVVLFVIAYLCVGRKNTAMSLDASE